MDKHAPHPDAEQDIELLVAYLDGELPAAACRQIERRLSEEEPFRRQLQGLDLAWHALDELPPTDVDERFAASTMEMVTLAAEEELAARTVALPIARRRRTLLVTLACVVAASAGFAAARYSAPDPNRTLIVDLPLLVQLDNYLQFREVEFLRRLASEVSAEELAGRSGESAAAADNLRAIVGETPEQRRRRIEHMTPDEQTKLAASADRFRRYSEQRQRDIRNLHEELLQDPNAAQLQETMIAYGRWAGEFSPGDQAELRELPPHDRVVRIKRQVRRGQRKAAMQLSKNDADALRQELLRLVNERISRIRQFVQRRRSDNEPRSRRAYFEHRPTQQQLRRIALWDIHRSLASDPALFERLVSILSEQAQSRLRSEFQRRNVELLRTWIRIAFESDSSPGDLENFFVDQLDSERREELLAMPPLEMQDALESQYLRENFDWADAPLPGWEWLAPRGEQPGRRPYVEPADRDRRGQRPPGGVRRNGRDRFGPPDNRHPLPARTTEEAI